MMVAYSFQKRFVAPILAGTKAQTIRAHRQRHARPGEELQLYTGMRTRHCRLIGRAICVNVDPIALNIAPGRVYWCGLVFRRRAELDAFASRDGFDDWAALSDFWRQQHGDAGRFQGVLIRWDAAPFLGHIHD